MKKVAACFFVLLHADVQISGVNTGRVKGVSFVMAQRRMFSLRVVETDRFLDLPAHAQALYFHLGMHGDDDGFVAAPKRIARSLGCGEGELRLLEEQGYIIRFESGVVAVRDWLINNTLKNDRYHETVYQKEKARLLQDASGRYDPLAGMEPAVEPKWIQNGSGMEPTVEPEQTNITNITNGTKHNTPSGRAATQARPDGVLEEEMRPSGAGRLPPPDDQEEYERWLLAPFAHPIMEGGPFADGYRHQDWG